MLTCNILFKHINLLGHGLSLQFFVSTLGPWQSMPPCWGCMHVLVRSCTPGPQVTEQLLHSVQFFHTPSTMKCNHKKSTYIV